MSKILVTGAGGFIGSHLVELLLNEGYNVKAFLHYNSRNSWGWLESNKHLRHIDIVMGDISDLDSVSNALQGCNSVFHLAALIGIPYSYVSPAAYIRTNISGTYNVLEVSKKIDLENVIITSTSETYGSAQYVPIDENHPLVGQSPYSASKIAADQLAISYYKSFDLPVKVVRPFNTFGPRQSARAIIPSLISQILEGEKEIKVGCITPTRDFTFIEDTVNGFYEIFKTANLYGEVTNIGMGKEISIAEIIKIICTKLNSNLKIISEEARVRPVNSEVERLLCDNSKILKHTNWRPKYNLSSGLDKTIEWIKSNLLYFKTRLYNV